MDEVFKFLNPKSNDCLSNLDNKSLVELIRCLSLFKPKLRENLSIEDTVKFGLEIEYDDSFDSTEIATEIKNNFPLWHHEKDGSLGPDGGEVISSVFSNKKYIWQDLDRVCKYLTSMGAIASDKTAAHVNYGLEYFENSDNFINFLLQWKAYENVIYRFGYGSSALPRSAIQLYASPMAKAIDTLDLEKLKSLPFARMIYEIDSVTDKYLYDDFSLSYCINLDKARDLKNYRLNNLIELRNNNGTIEAHRWQNYVNFGAKFIESSKDSNFDPDIVFKRILENRKGFSNLDYYRQVDFKGALELADRIFDNNLDKIYFLAQYFIKDNKGRNLDFEKTFIKK